MSDEFTFDVNAVDVEALDDEAGIQRVYFAIDLATISDSPEELALAERIYTSFISSLRQNPLTDKHVRVRTLAFGQQNSALSDLLAPAECPPWEALLDTEYASGVSADSLIALLEQQATQDELTLQCRNTSRFRSRKTHVSPWSAVVLPASGNAPFKESELEILTEHRAADRMWKTHLLNLRETSSTIGWGLRNWDVSPDQVDELFPKILELDAFWDSDVITGTTYVGDDFEGDTECGYAWDDAQWRADAHLPDEESPLELWDWDAIDTGPILTVEDQREFVWEDHVPHDEDLLIDIPAAPSTESDERAADQQARVATRFPEITVQESALGDLARIGRGGQGVVYSGEGALQGLVSPEGFVYKQFIDVPDRTAIVEQSGELIERLFTLPEQDQRLLRQHLVAPLRLVAANDELVGIVMRRIPDTFLFDLKLSAGKTKRSLFELQHLMVPESKKPEYGIPGATAKDRLYLFLDLLRIVECLHRGGIVLGDINPGNVALRVLTPVGAATRRRFEPLLLGVDGFRAQGQVPRSPQMHTPNWLPPEVRAAAILRDELIVKGAPPIEVSRARAAANIQTTKSDIYKLGLLLLRLFHVPSDPQHDDTQNIYRSEVAERNITRLVGRGRAELLLSALDENPEARPNTSQLLAAFTAG